MKNNRGITLVALVVTIIVLLILSAVGINLVLGENGIITRAKEAKTKSEFASRNESENLDNLYNELESNLSDDMEKIEISGEVLSRLPYKNVKNESYWNPVDRSYSRKDSGMYIVEKDGKKYEAILKNEHKDESFVTVEECMFDLYLVKEIEDVPDIYNVTAQRDLRNNILESTYRDTDSGGWDSRWSALVKYNDKVYVKNAIDYTDSIDGLSYTLFSIDMLEGNLKNVKADAIIGICGFSLKSNNEIESIKYTTAETEFKVDNSSKDIIDVEGLAVSNMISSNSPKREKLKALGDYIDSKTSVTLELDSGSTYNVKDNGNVIGKVELISDINGVKEYRIVY